MGNRPIKEYRAGGIKTAIWFNEKEVDGNLVGFKTVTLSRSWRDRKANIWRNEALNLRKGDLAKAILVLNKAHEDILLSNEEKED